jgi:MFS family permease
MKTIATPLSAFSTRTFRLFFAGRAISLVGTAVGPIALAFAVIQMTRSASALGIVMAASMIPRLLFLLIGGVVGDRFPRIPVMVVSDYVNGIAEGAIAALVLTGRASIATLAVLAAVRGTASAFFMPASAGVVPHIVRPDQRQQANALLGLARNTTTVGGAALAGILVAAVSPGWVLVFDAATYVCGATILLRLKLPSLERMQSSGVFAAVREGWGMVRSRRWLLAVIVQFGFVNAFGTGFFLVLGPFVAEERYHGAATWGVVMAAQSAGMVIAGLVGLRFTPRRPLLLATSLVPLFALPLALFAIGAPATVLVIGAAAAGVAMELFGVLWDTTLQQHIPSEKLSRVYSFDLLTSFVFIPLGLVVAGPLAHSIGAERVLWLGAGVVVAASAAVLMSTSVWRVHATAPEDIPGALPAAA